MKEMKTLVIFTCILLGSALIIGCPTGSTNTTREIEKGVILDWSWEVLDDINPNKFSPGISILNESSYVEHPYKYSQSYVLKDKYVKNFPETGWYLTEWDNVTKTEVAVMVDAKGYATGYFDKAANTFVGTPWPKNREEGELVRLREPQVHQVEGPDGTMVDAFHLSGILMQRGSETEDTTTWTSRSGSRTNPEFPTSDRDYRLGAGWPAITLFATPPTKDIEPEQETRKALLDGYGYTFWVKSNVDYICYRTAIENWDYRPYENHEPGHWFGVRPGRDGTDGVNFTRAPPYQWTQVKVVYDPLHPDYNVAVNNWITMYDIITNYPGDEQPYTIADRHDKMRSVRISWMLQLQLNGGDQGEEFIEYSVTTGRHVFDVYFYGLELLQYE